MDLTASATGGSSNGIVAPPSPRKKQAAPMTATTAGAAAVPSNAATSANLGKRKRAGSNSGNVVKSHTKRTSGQATKQEYSLSSIGMGKTSSGASEEFQDQIVPTQDQSIKLARVIRMLDKYGIGTQALPEEAGVPTLLDALDPASAGWPHSVAAIEFYLDLALNGLQARLAGAEALPNTSNFSETVRGLLDDIRQDARSRIGLVPREKARPAKYALHRTIGNDMDLFSSAIEMPFDPSLLNKLSDTDVVAVHEIPAPSQPSSLSLATSEDRVRLKDINPHPSASKNQPTDLVPRVEPVSFLYYDAYASFAPTYDSGRATMSYAQSVHVKTSRQTVRDWETRSIKLPPLPPTSRASDEGASRDVAKMLHQAQSTSSGEGLSEEDIAWALKTMDTSRVIDQRLAQTAEHLKYLQEAQWARLRASQERGSIHSQRVLPSATAEENEAAQRIVEGLSGILNARPRVFGDVATALPSSKDDFRRLAKELVQTRTEGYYGSLDKMNAKAIRNDVMTIQKTEQGNEMQLDGTGANAGGAQPMKRTASQKKQRKKEKAEKAAAATAAAQAMAGGQ